MQSTMPSNYKTTDFTGQTFYVGLDVHKSSWTVTVRTSGLEVSHFRQDPDAGQLLRHLSKRYPGAEFVSAYEAGFCGTKIHQLLCVGGMKNLIIHPADLPKTDKQQKNKTDLHDSRAVARYLESGLLSSIYVMPVEQQERRALYRLREAKVKDVTRCNNRLRSFLYYFGVEVPTRFSDKKHISHKFLSWLSSLNTLGQQGKNVLDRLIEELIHQRKELLQITKTLKESIGLHYPQQYKSLLTVPGYGPVTSIALLAETGNLARFKNPDQFTSYLGLMPAEHSSGENLHSARVQPRCNTHLRPVLIEAAWAAIRKCPVLLAYYKKHAVKNNKKAIVKVARKLALIAKAVALNESTYHVTTD
jgi:transposase